MKAGLDILYIASHGFAVRMIIQTDLLGRLTKKNLKIAVVTPDSNDYTLDEYCKKNSLTNITFNPEHGFFTGSYQVFRKYVLEDIRNNPAHWEKHLRNIDKNQSIKRKLKFKAYYLTHKIFNTFQFLKKAFLWVELNLLNSKQAEELIKNLKPKLVVSTYPANAMEAMVLKAASPRFGCKRVIHLLSWDNITCKGRFIQMGDYYLTWGDIMKKELIKYYRVKEKQIFKVGVPHFDIHVNNFEIQKNKVLLKAVGLDPEIPYMFFGMSSPYFAPSEIEIVEKLAEWVENNYLGNLQLVVRPHPQNMQGHMSDASWLPRLKALESKKVYVDYPQLNKSKISWSMKFEDMFELSNFIGGAVITLNSGSTISIDALMHDKPVVLTVFDGDNIFPWHLSVKRVSEYEHIRNLTEIGGVIPTNNYNELKETIIKCLNNPDLNKEARQKTIQAQCFQIDGKSTERVVNILSTLCSN